MQWSEDDRHPALGSSLRIRLPSDLQRKGQAFDLVVRYETTAKCTAAQWLAPAYAVSIIISTRGVGPWRGR